MHGKWAKASIMNTLIRSDFVENLLSDLTLLFIYFQVSTDKFQQFLYKHKFIAYMRIKA